MLSFGSYCFAVLSFGFYCFFLIAVDGETKVSRGVVCAKEGLCYWDATRLTKIALILSRGEVQSPRAHHVAPAQWRNIWEGE